MAPKQKQDSKTEAVTLERDGKTKTVTSAESVVRLQFEGWKVKKAGKDAPVVAQPAPPAKQ